MTEKSIYFLESITNTIIRLSCAGNAEDYAKYLKIKSNRSRKRSKIFIKFLSKKILGIGDASQNTVLNILSFAEPMERENRVIKYKMDHIEQFPEMKKLLKA